MKANWLKWLVIGCVMGWVVCQCAVVFAFQGDPTSVIHLKQTDPTLWSIIMFFNPPVLESLGMLGIVITAVGGLASFGISMNSEGIMKMFWILLGMYCVGRLATFFLIFALAGHGA